MPATLLVRPLVSLSALSTLLTAMGEIGAPASGQITTPVWRITPPQVVGSTALAPQLPGAPPPKAEARPTRRSTRAEVEAGPVRITPDDAPAAPEVESPEPDAPIRIRPLASFREPARANPDSDGGCTFDLGVATAYAARGLNTFQVHGQHDLAPLLSPSVECGLGSSGIAVGYAGAFQVGGDGATQLVADGVGAENDVYVSVERELSDTVSVGVAAMLILYPFAEGSTPVYAEPSAHVAWSPGLDLDLELVYSTGLHAAEGYAPYVYVHPTVGKELEIGSLATLQLGAGAGWKGYPLPDAPVDNTWDAHLDLGLQKELGKVYVAPAIHAAGRTSKGRTSRPPASCGAPSTSVLRSEEPNGALQRRSG